MVQSLVVATKSWWWCACRDAPGGVARSCTRKMILHQGGAGTRCNFQESAADVGTVEFARWPCSSTRPHSSSSSNLLCVRKDLSLVSFSAEPDQHPGFAGHLLRRS